MNLGPSAYQSDALPTELSSEMGKNIDFYQTEKVSVVKRNNQYPILKETIKHGQIKKRFNAFFLLTDRYLHGSLAYTKTVRLDVRGVSKSS